MLGSPELIAAFLCLPLALFTALALALARLVRNGVLPVKWFARALCLGFAWLLAWGILAHGRSLDSWQRFPPPALFALLVLFGVTLGIAFSRFGLLLARHLSFTVLIGLQVFRLPLELAMYRAMLEGLMPVQMSFAGFNYDIVTGTLSACLVLWSVWRPLPRWVIWVFNGLGMSLLGVVLAIAVASLPSFAAFGADRVNTWVFDFPYLYLPAVLVQVALLGHLLVFRKLRLTSRQPGFPIELS